MQINDFGGYGKTTRVNVGSGKDEFVFYHGDTVPEHVAVSLEFEEQVVAPQREFLKTLPVSNADYLYKVVTAHTAANILPNLVLTYPEE